MLGRSLSWGRGCGIVILGVNDLNEARIFDDFDAGGLLKRY